MTGKVQNTDFLSGGGEMGERIRSFNWENTPLGEPSEWPESLKTCVRIMLSSPQPIWIGWGKSLIKLYNDPYKGIVRGKHPEALGQPASVVWSDIWKDIEPMLQKVMENDEGTYVQSQLLIMERSGYPEETYYTFSYTPVLGDDGRPAGMICFNTDDTERILAERQLRTLSLLGKQLVDCTTEADIFERTVEVIGSNPHDFPFALIYNINGKAATLAASAGVDASDNCAPEILTLKDSDQSWPLFDASAKEEIITVDDLQSKFSSIPTGIWNVPAQSAFIIPVAASGASGINIVLVSGINPYRKPDDKYRNFFQLIADQLAAGINTVRMLEDERNRSRALEELDKSKTIFFSNISHEFRTPLTLMLGTIEETLNDPQTRLQNMERMQITHRNAMRLLKLVNTLLDFSRIESGRQKASFALTDITALTKNLAANFHSVFERAGLNFEVIADSVIKPVYLDQQMWEKIVFNLLSNAFKYTLQGSVRVSLNATSSAAIMRVEDTGIGIPEEELPNMFERFHRIEGAAGRSYEGTGIGLSLTKELIQLHGGEISVESTFGKGSVFTVRIPFGKDHLPVGQTSDSPGSYEERTADAFVEEAGSLLDSVESIQYADTTVDSTEKQRTVLVVDDNADMRKHIGSILNRHFHVITAANGMEALHRISEQIPDLVLTDIMMPVMDGIQLLKEIRNNIVHLHIPVILLTARAGEESRMHGLETGADDYLVKPFSANEIIARIKAQINISERRQIVEQRLRDLFAQAPAIIHILKGPEHEIEFFHPMANEYVKGRDVRGMRMRDAVNNIESPGYFAQLDEAFNTGRTIRTDEVQIIVNGDNGDVQERYYDITVQPYRNEQGQVEGVLNFAVEVTEKVLTRRELEASEQEYRKLSIHLEQLVAERTASLEKANHELIERNHFIEMIIDNSQDMISVYSNDFTLLSVNKTVEEMLGLSRQKMIGKKFSDLFPHAVGSRQESDLQRVFKGETIKNDPFFSEVTKRYIRNYMSPLRNADGNVYAALAIATDVSNIMESQAELKRSQQHFKTLFQMSPVAKSLSRLNDGFIIDVNPAWENLFSMDKENVIGKTAAELNLFDPEVRKAKLKVLTEQGGATDGVELQFKTGRGTLVDAYTSVVVIEVDEITCLLTAYVDISQRKLAEKKITETAKQLEQKNAELEEAQRLAHIGSWEWEPSAGKLKWSEELCKIYGVDPKSYVPDFENYMSMIHPDDRELMNTVIEESARTKSPFNFTHRIILHDGTVKTLQARGEVFTDDNGTLLRMAGTAQDITVSASMTAALEEKNEELQRSNKALESFNYIASHDLQEPLRKIQTFIQLVQRSDNDSAAFKKYFDKINNSAKRMSELIQSVLVYSRLSETDEDKRPVDLNTVLADVMNDLELRITEKNAEIVADKLPVINANSLQMYQLFTNLISNSLKFTTETPSVRITSEIINGQLNSYSESRKYVELVFQDNGIGFNPEFSDKIFDLFKRLHGRQQYAGTGIGLSIVKKIVDQHNGKVSASSEVGKGAAFTIQLPL